MQIGVIGSGDVGTTLAKGFHNHGHKVMIGTRSPEKLRSVDDLRQIAVASVAETAQASADLLVLAVKGSAALEALRLAGHENLRGKIVVDTTNPLADAPPVQGVLSFFTDRNQSLMEILQQEYAEARFVKAFNSVGAASMIDAVFDTGRPTMFICGDDAQAKKTVETLLDDLGWGTEDMGGVVAARAIEPLSMLWCIPGFLNQEWTHAFKLLRR